MTPKSKSGRSGKPTTSRVTEDEDIAFAMGLIDDDDDDTEKS